MNIRFAATLFAAALLLGGCKSMKTTADRDPNYDFDAIRTYQWTSAPPEVLKTANTYLNEDIPKAIDHELDRRGLELTATNADVRVAYYLKLKEQKEYTDLDQSERDFAGGFTYSRASKSWEYDKHDPDLTVYTTDIASLTLLVYDGKSGKQVWSGTLKTKIDRSRPRPEQVELVQEATRKLMEKFPVRPLSAR